MDQLLLGVCLLAGFAGISVLYGELVLSREYWTVIRHEIRNSKQHTPPPPLFPWRKQKANKVIG